MNFKGRRTAAGNPIK